PKVLAAMNTMVVAFIGTVHLDLNQSRIFFPHCGSTRCANSIYRAFRARIYGLRRIPKAVKPRCTALLPLCRVFSPRRWATANFEGRITRVPSLYLLHVLRRTGPQLRNRWPAATCRRGYTSDLISAAGMRPSAADPAWSLPSYSADRHHAGAASRSPQGRGKRVIGRKIDRAEQPVEDDQRGREILVAGPGLAAARDEIGPRAIFPSLAAVQEATSAATGSAAPASTKAAVLPRSSACAAVVVAKRCMLRAMMPVQPVWWLAPRPAPLSP